MESLNISKLNLSSVKTHTSTELVAKTKMNENDFEDNPMAEDEYLREYREEIWDTLIEQDLEKPKIYLHSPQLEFRGSLVQMLRDVTKKLGLNIGTLHGAVAHLDLFMDSYRLRSDRLSHVALASFSLAAKSEEEFSRAPSLKTLCRVTGIKICGEIFQKLEWAVGQHVQWRLMTPTPATFAALLAQYIGTDAEVPSNPEFRAKFRRDAVVALNKYLDMTLSDVRLKLIDSVIVGCACVACARAAMGLPAWPPWLAQRARRPHACVSPLARLLQRMMEVMTSRITVQVEVDQGYGSARNSPNITPSASPTLPASPALSNCSSSSRSQNGDAYRQIPVSSPVDFTVPNCTVLDLSTPTVPPASFYELPSAVDMTVQRVDNPDDYRYCKARRMIDSTDGASTSAAFKRGLDPNVEPERKRYRLSTQMSEVAR